MRFDLYAELESLQACPTTCALPYGLASGFVDDCTMWFTKGERDPDPEAGKRKKNDARMRYQNRAAAGKLPLPPGLNLDSGLGAPLPKQWLAIEIKFKLQSPRYSHDDRSFHVLDNPVRKDRVFGVPYMSAASWKGLLRWAYRMRAGLIGPAPIQDEEERRKARAYELHLFGNEKVEKEDFVRGALAFYPTWFDKVGFEVINPHSRKRRAGTQPILYEVVPPDTEGVLRLLYAPLPGAAQRDGVKTVEALQNLLDAAEQLLTVYGFSAKRTAGWGIAEVIEARANGREWKEENPIRKLKDELASLLSSEIE
jgi:CRISPR-associated protein Cmr2